MLMSQQLLQNDNLLDSECQVLVNTVNCRKAMGKGIALAFKNKYPEMYDTYRLIRLSPAKVWVWRLIEGNNLLNRFVFNLATKDDWINPSKYEWIWDGLRNLDIEMKRFGIKSIAIPPLGCGNGGLDWCKVERMIALFHDIFWQDVYVELYEPKGI